MKNYVVLVDFGDEGYYYAEHEGREYFTSDKDDARTFDNAQEAASVANSLQGIAVPTEGEAGIGWVSQDDIPTKNFVNRSLS